MKLIIVHSALLLSLFVSLSSNAQSDREIIQFTGVVLSEENEMALPGVHIYTPTSGRGTTTNAYGYFSMAVRENDSLMVTAVGYERQLIIVPDVENQSHTMVIEMPYDTTYLPEMEVTPYLSEADFKHAILSLRVRQQYAYRDMKEKIDDVLIQKMQEHLPQRPGGNHYLVSNTYRYHTATIPLTNPFAWRKMIKNMKKRKR